MPIIESIAGLFKTGAVGAVEQFFKGITVVRDLLAFTRNYLGPEYQIENSTINEFGSIVRRAISAHGLALGSGDISKVEIPEWPDSPFPGEFIQRGLAGIKVSASSGDKVYSTHIPFEFHHLEILNYDQILDRINNAISEGFGFEEEFYQADIDRIEQAVRAHRIQGADTTFDAELTGIYQGR